MTNIERKNHDDKIMRDLKKYCKKELFTTCDCLEDLQAHIMIDNIFDAQEKIAAINYLQNQQIIRCNKQIKELSARVKKLETRCCSIQ